MSGSRLAIFTICSNNYVPMAKVLLETASQHHPSADMYLFLADERLDTEGFYPPICQTIPAEQLDIPNFYSLAFRYDIMEFNTAIKPFCFLHLLERSYEQVIYFDPDIQVFQHLESVLYPITQGASFVLTPHLCQPSPGSDHPSDLTIMQAGVYNLGFLAVGATPETMTLLRWWARRLEYECINAQERGIFVDQKFMDLVPGFADNAVVLRDTALNVAYWNLHQRPLDCSDGRWYVDGRPIGFFHFSGFDPKHKTTLSKHTHHWRHDSITPPLAELMKNYGEWLLRNGFGTLPGGLYAYGHFASGRKISSFIRQIFREDYPIWPTNPFEDFDQQISARVAVPWAGPLGGQITNLMNALREREPWLREHFDPAQPSSAARYIQWWLLEANPYAGDEGWIEDVSKRVGDSRNPGRQTTARSTNTSADVDVIGYLELASDVGEAGRLTLNALSKSNVAVSGIPIRLNARSSEIDTGLKGRFVRRGVAPVQIFSVNADQYSLVKDHLIGIIRDDAYRIMVPFWELSNLPDQWVSAFNYVDEVWAPTTFIQAALVRKLSIPVFHMPLALATELALPIPRRNFNLPTDKFLFFFAFDCLSHIERKNPEAVVRAFKEAFRQRGGKGNAALIIKTQNAQYVPEKYQGLWKTIENDPDIFVIDQTLSRADTFGLIAACDAVISLHRSEGLGLHVAEAMMLGRPVIATDYSATRELVTPKTGWPVDMRLIPVQEGQYPFADGQVWADADVLHAAWQMRRVYQGGDEVSSKTEAAKLHLEACYGLGTVMKRQRNRLRRIGV